MSEQFKSQIFQYIDRAKEEFESIPVPENLDKNQAWLVKNLPIKISNDIKKVINEIQDPGWKHIDKICNIIAGAIDSRDNIDKVSGIGISYEGTYQNHKLEWVAQNLKRLRSIYERIFIISEIEEMLHQYNAKHKKLDPSTLEKKNPGLYLRLIKILHIQNPQDPTQWKNIYKHLNPDLWNIFVEEAETEEKLEKDILDLIDKEKLEELIIKFGGKPGKLLSLLRCMYPHIELNKLIKLTSVGFSGLGIAAKLNLERIEQEYSETLSSIKNAIKKVDYIGHNTYIVNGIAPKDCKCIYVSGFWSKRNYVKPGKSFQFSVRVNGGKQGGNFNEISFVSINMEDETRSDIFTIGLEAEEPEGDEDYEVSFLTLINTKVDIKKLMESGNVEFLYELLEMTVIKHFSHKFEEGEKYMKEVLLKEFKGTKGIENMLHEILEKFKAINETTYTQLRDDVELMFFQKYCIYKLNQFRQKGLPGVILAPEPGLGKTAITLTAVDDDEASIITPNTLVSNWEEESKKFLKKPSMEILYDMTMKDRVEKLQSTQKEKIVTNYQTIQQIKNKKIFDALNKRRHMNKSKVVVFEEAHIFKNTETNQSQGAKMLDSDFQVWITASPFKNPTEFCKMMNSLLPDDSRFKSLGAFLDAFPPNKPETLEQLNHLKRDYVIRFLKEDVLLDYDLQIPLEEQNNRLPHKEYIEPKKLGQFTMLPEQAQAIALMFKDYKAWEEKYRQYFSKDRIVKEDRSKVFEGNYLSKKHAYKQIVNNPKYVGLDNVLSPKHTMMKSIVDKEVSQRNKVLIFVEYQDQANIYKELFSEYKPAIFTGETSNAGFMKDEYGKIIKYKQNKHEEWMFDEKGYPIIDEQGQSMSVMDYERHTFQNAQDRKVVIVNLQAGAFGTTFTGAGVTIYDDLPRDYTQEYQSEDRTHRIDNERKKYKVKYYYLQAQYPEVVLGKAKEEILFDQKLEDGELVERKISLYDKYFKQGTYDEVKYIDLQNQKVMFRLINDEIETELFLEQFAEKTNNFFLGA